MNGADKRNENLTEPSHGEVVLGYAPVVAAVATTIFLTMAAIDPMSFRSIAVGSASGIAYAMMLALHWRLQARDSAWTLLTWPVGVTFVNYTSKLTEDEGVVVFLQYVALVNAVAFSALTFVKPRVLAYVTAESVVVP